MCRTQPRIPLPTEQAQRPPSLMVDGPVCSQVLWGRGTAVPALVISIICLILNTLSMSKCLINTAGSLSFSMPIPVLVELL